MSSKKRGGRLIVVDASVVQSASDSEHAVPHACRKFLERIRDICHRVVTARPIEDEWRRHRSQFASKWRTSMAARKKPLLSVDIEELVLDLSSCPEKRRLEIEKDLPYIAAALATDGVFVTRDTRIRELIREIPGGEAVVAQIRWINPDTDALEVLENL